MEEHTFLHNINIAFFFQNESNMNA